MEINARELARLLELRKKEAELELKKAVVGNECQKELSAISSGVCELSRKVQKAGIELIIPRQSSIDELNSRIKEFSAEQLKEGLRTRSGEAYQVLSERGALVRENYENRLEIAKICMVAARMGGDERKVLADAVRAGVVENGISLESIDENNRERLARFMRRCGIGCMVSGSSLLPDDGNEGKEVRFELSNRNVWVSEETKEKLESNLERIRGISPEIQLRNAQRHIKEFNEEEEKAFESLQHEYLQLLKEQDELLREFNEEENLSVTI